MATLFAVYDSDGYRGRCDASCYEAQGPVCTCVCGGKNHGVGRQQAEANVRAYTAEMLAEWLQAHPETAAAVVEAVAQLALGLTDG